MIIVNLKGGLGNQMFQYALGRKLVLQNDDVLKLDVIGLDRVNKSGDIYRPFALNNFNIKNEIATLEEVQRIKYPFGIISKGVRWFNFKILRDMHIGWEPKILKKTGDIYLDGFWQSPKYFEDIREIIIEDFSLKAPFSASAQKYADMMKGCTAVSIHVRRGDYATNTKVNKTYGECTSLYYKKAVSMISSKVVDPVYFVFSDDIDWVKENLKIDAPCIFVSGPEIKDCEELVLMSKCKHNIIANSTFSWWGAWLNQKEGKIVIAPKPWFEKNEKHFKHLIPEKWTRIEKK